MSDLSVTPTSTQATSSNFQTFAKTHMVACLGSSVVTFVVVYVLGWTTWLQKLKLIWLPHLPDFLKTGVVCWVMGLICLTLTYRYAQKSQSNVTLLKVCIWASDILMWVPLVMAVSYWMDADSLRGAQDWYYTRYQDPMAGQYVTQYRGHQPERILVWGFASIQEVQNELHDLKGSFEEKIAIIHGRHNDNPKVVDMAHHVLEWDGTFVVYDCQAAVHQLPQGFVIRSINGVIPTDSVDETLKLCDRFNRNKVVIQSMPDFLE